MTYIVFQITVGGNYSAILLRLELAVTFRLSEFQLPPLHNGCGKAFFEAKLTLGIRKIHITHVSGLSSRLSVCNTQRQGLLILVDAIMHLSDQVGPKNLLKMPASVVWIIQSIYCLMYTIITETPYDTEAGRTYSLEVPKKIP